MKTFKELVGEIKEALKRTIVYRAGKKKVLRKATKKGFKNVGGKEVKMKRSEIRSREKAMKKVARRLGGKRAKMARKRAKTMKRRGDR